MSEDSLNKIAEGLINRFHVELDKSDLTHFDFLNLSAPEVLYHKRVVAIHLAISSQEWLIFNLNSQAPTEFNFEGVLAHSHRIDDAESLLKVLRSKL